MPAQSRRLGFQLGSYLQALHWVTWTLTNRVKLPSANTG